MTHVVFGKDAEMPFVGRTKMAGIGIANGGCNLTYILCLFHEIIDWPLSSGIAGDICSQETP